MQNLEEAAVIELIGNRIVIKEMSNQLVQMKRTMNTLKKSNKRLKRKIGLLTFAVSAICLVQMEILSKQDIEIKKLKGELEEMQTKGE